ncbi:MAG: SPOR domain-containing protein [Methylobacter sp.]
MDHELKQRLIGAVVVTALCAIFIPMLFDDPVDTSGQLVSELNIPAPVDSGANTADKLPSSAEQVSKLPEPEPLSTEAPGDTIESTGAAEELIEEPAAGQSKQGRSEEGLYAESEGYAREDAGVEEVVEAEDTQPKPRPKQLPIEQPLSAAVAPDSIRKSMAPKTQVRDSYAEPMVKEPVKVKKIVEPVKLPVRKPEVEPLVSAVSDAARQPVVKQPNSAKSLAAAVAEAKKPPVAAPKTTPKMARWYIQLGSFSKKENAMSLWESLHEQGLPASLDTVQTDKGTSYRLRVGPELDGKKAAAMKSRLDRLNIKAILISE